MSYDIYDARKKAKFLSKRNPDRVWCVFSYGDGSYTVLREIVLQAQSMNCLVHGRIVHKFKNGKEI
jgi:hypothetical protein